MFMSHCDNMQVIIGDFSDVGGNYSHLISAAGDPLMHTAIDKHVARAAISSLESQQETIAKTRIVHTNSNS
jgi:hypothetical protein